MAEGQGQQGERNDASAAGEEAVVGVARTSQEVEPEERVRRSAGPADDPAPRRRHRRVSRWDDEDAEDDTERLQDEGSRLARAMTIGFFRQIEAISEITGDFAASVLDGTRERGEESTRSAPRTRAEEDYDRDDDEYDDEPLPRAASRARRRPSHPRKSGRSSGGKPASFKLTNLAEDVYDGFMDAFRDISRVPGDVVDDVYDSYETDRPRRRGRRTKRSV